MLLNQDCLFGLEMIKMVQWVKFRRLWL